MSSIESGQPQVTRPEGPGAIEWSIGSPEITVRGLIWRGEKLPVLFVHGPGSDNDLDRWKSLPEFVRQAGHSVIVLDLPGHGLSEGDPGESNAVAAVRHVCQNLRELLGAGLAIVTEGAGNRLVPPEPFRALIVLSPRDESSAQTDYPKLVICGAAEPEARTAADRYLRASRGWTLVSSFGTSAQGATLLETPHAPKIAAQVLSFLRDYG